MNNGFYKRRWLPVYAIPANQKAAFSGSFAIDRNTLTTKMATDATGATAAGSSTSAELKCFIHSESAWSGGGTYFHLGGQRQKRAL